MSRSGFLLAEDEALKVRLSNLTVSDDSNNNRPVKVFFRYPEGETEKHYPFITIEMVALNYAVQRQQSEHLVYYSSANAASHSMTENDPMFIGYYPSELDSDALDAQLANTPNIYLRMEAPIPVDLTYQVTTYTRSALHDRQLTAYMLRHVFPFRSNYLVIPSDGTVRRLDMTGWSQSDLLDGEAGYRKRIFRKVYNVTINAEIPRSDLQTIEQVTSIIGNISNIEGGNPQNNPSLSEEF